VHEVAHRISGLTDFGTGYRGDPGALPASKDRHPLFMPADRELTRDAASLPAVKGRRWSVTFPGFFRRSA
jgi:hypothetical protein